MFFFCWRIEVKSVMAELHEQLNVYTMDHHGTGRNNHDHASWESANPNKTRDAITKHVAISGLKTGVSVATVVGTAVLTANKYSAAFRNRLNTSGKTALVVMSFLASFTVSAERRLVQGAHNPEMYMATMDGTYIAPKQETSKLKLWQRGANFLYDHPYRCLATVGAPLVGSIYAYQHLNKGISASQQVMHTRIYGQASVVVLLLSSMAFHDYMAKRGKFGEEDENEE
ncbi:hypothetical protein BBO99_00008255 [Phytophthora kernoviae]|uniref:HIG1 domain-containing protein n=2 Tax=Phytophthora kernoviae TaxID=325452 RepID=A0A3R7JPZ9_9STRA|nr:hypothetical protein G195_009293 [Phytophthora kernoviae 00238/432]KAG2516565.1 hypothetical protein JM18_007971 [Phytophthora kernoviae]KAG2521216.1 hypothetical protein JM16_006370 [Phytophthora kernoviae]RLM96143.1 hypothetical protein BBI17_008222 [Phytophthora kernoviae]RLN75541.1 hypothetical protein BBO99_00008255 [Phytophthora kernoviae]